MKLEKRSSFRWPSTSGGGRANPKNGLVVHYDGSDQGLANRPHSACRAYWKRTRQFHMGPSRGWSDIGYSYGCCPHGIIMEGRGLNRSQAAQPGGNSTWYSVTFMGGPNEHPTAVQLVAFRQLRAYLMAPSRGVRGAVSYHGRFISTSCPGSILRSMVVSGAILSGETGGANPPPVTGGRVLRKGMSGADVTAAQAQLVYLGYNVGTYGADGRFGDDTEKAVKAFQRDAGIGVDGVVGDQTWAALEAAVERERVEMPEHNRFYTTKSQPLPRNQWKQVEFHGSSRDPNAGGGLYTVAFGDCLYSVTGDVRIAGLNPGDEFQIRFAEYELVDGAWTRVRARGIAEYFHGDGKTYNTNVKNGHLSGKRRLRMEVKQWTADDTVLEWAEVDPFTWDK